MFLFLRLSLMWMTRDMLAKCQHTFTNPQCWRVWHFCLCLGWYSVKQPVSGWQNRRALFRCNDWCPETRYSVRVVNIWAEHSSACNLGIYHKHDPNCTWFKYYGKHREAHSKALPPPCITSTLLHLNRAKNYFFLKKGQPHYNSASIFFKKKSNAVTDCLKTFFLFICLLQLLDYSLCLHSYRKTITLHMR